MSPTGKSSTRFSSIARALVRALSKLDGTISSGSASNSTFDMARIDERIAQLKAEGTRSPERAAPAPAPSVQPFGKRHTYP